MSELTEYPEWLRASLGLADPDLPGQLETHAGVLPVVDVLRGGLLSLPRREFFRQAAAGTFATTWTVTTTGNTGLGLNPTSADAVTAALAFVYGYATGGVVDMALAVHHGTNLTTPIYLAKKVQVPAGGHVGMVELTGDTRGIYIPPGGALFIFNGDTGAAQFNAVVTLYAVPPGWPMLP